MYLQKKNFKARLLSKKGCVARSSAKFRTKFRQKAKQKEINESKMFTRKERKCKGKELQWSSANCLRRSAVKISVGKFLSKKIFKNIYPKMYQVNFLIKVGMQKFLMRSWRGEMHLCMPVGNVCQHVSIYNQNWKTRDQCVLCCHNKHATVIRETNVNETSINFLQL